MRYLLQNGFSDELHARLKFIHETLNLWFIETPLTDSTFTQLTSIPSNCLDILFIVGHNHAVESYIQNHQIPEHIIVAITCDASSNFSKFKKTGKTIYIPKQDEQRYAELVNGSIYGFDFDLTESEIIFYNTRKNPDILQRLNSAFCKL